MLKGHFMILASNLWCYGTIAIKKSCWGLLPPYWISVIDQIYLLVKNLH